MRRNCFICECHRDKRRALQDEGGITSVLQHNAHVLIERLGLPSSVHVFDDTKIGEQTTTLRWDTGYSFPLTGFSWGYRGTGPNGLANFFETIGLAITLDEIASWGHGFESMFKLAKDYNGPQVQKVSN